MKCTTYVLGVSLSIMALNDGGLPITLCEFADGRCIATYRWEETRGIVTSFWPGFDEFLIAHVPIGESRAVWRMMIRGCLRFRHQIYQEQIDDLLAMSWGIDGDPDEFIDLFRANDVQMEQEVEP